MDCDDGGVPFMVRLFSSQESEVYLKDQCGTIMLLNRAEYIAFVLFSDEERKRQGSEPRAVG